MSASGCVNWNYKPQISADVDITAPAYVEAPSLSIDRLHLTSTPKGIEVYDTDAICCDNPEYTLVEKEVRRLHSFLSQWLETNQQDYF